MTVSWNAADVPAVDANDLLLAVRAWRGEAERGHLAVATVGGQLVGSSETIERRIADACGGDAARVLAVMLRWHCLAAALSCRRFRATLESGDEAWLCRAAAAAARLRVNATIGLSPVRLAWAIAADERATAKLTLRPAIAA